MLRITAIVISFLWGLLKMHMMYSKLLVEKIRARKEPTIVD